METAFLYLIIVLAGGLIVSAVVRSRPDATEDTRSTAVGIYDIITGVMMLVVGLINYEEYLPKNEQALYMLLKWFGGIWIATGLIQIGFTFFKKCLEQEIENKLDDRIRELRESEQKSQQSKTGWTCDCGRSNADYVSTCVCGKDRTHD